MDELSPEKDVHNPGTTGEIVEDYLIQGHERSHTPTPLTSKLQVKIIHLVHTEVT